MSQAPQIRLEQIHDGFVKYHLDIGCPASPVIHEFHGPEGGYPHDHPWDKFTSHVLSGWYIEQIWMHDPGRHWIPMEFRRKAGDTFTVTAGHIHTITRTAPEGCWTVCTYGEWVREPLFYKFQDGHLLGTERADRRYLLDEL